MSYLFDFHAQYTAVLTACMLFYCWEWIKPRFGWSAMALLMFCAASSLWVWAWKDNRYLPINPYDQMALRYFAADSLAKILIVSSAMAVLAESRLRMQILGEWVISGFVIVNSLFALWEARKDCNGLTCGGVIGNPSISMGLMACCLPVFIHSWKKQIGILLLAAAAIFLSKSSIAIGLLGMYAVFWLFPWDFNFQKLLWPVLATAGIFGISRLSLGSELLNDSDRFKVWNDMMHHWAVWWNVPFGTGLGTYHVFSINLQQINQVSPGSWWNTLHNDWLQMLFEGGVVGAFLLFSTYLSALFKLYREENWRLLLSALMYGAYMTLDPALHNPLPILFGAWLFVYALRYDNFKEYV